MTSILILKIIETKKNQDLNAIPKQTLGNDQGSYCLLLPQFDFTHSF